MNACMCVDYSVFLCSCISSSLKTRIHSSGVEDLICYVRPIFFFLRREVQITFELQFRFTSG